MSASSGVYHPGSSSLALYSLGRLCGVHFRLLGAWEAITHPTSGEGFYLVRVYLTSYNRLTS
jgi:hypothetical protein